MDWHEEAEANSEDLRAIRGALFLKCSLKSRPKVSITSIGSTLLKEALSLSAFLKCFL